jgi:CcmD family protein
MDKNLLLISAFAVAWLAFGVYISLLARRQAGLEKRLQKIESAAAASSAED